MDGGIALSIKRYKYRVETSRGWNVVEVEDHYSILTRKDSPGGRFLLARTDMTFPPKGKSLRARRECHNRVKVPPRVA